MLLSWLLLGHLNISGKMQHSKYLICISHVAKLIICLSELICVKKVLLSGMCFKTQIHRFISYYVLFLFHYSAPEWKYIHPMQKNILNRQEIDGQFWWEILFLAVDRWMCFKIYVVMRRDETKMELNIPSAVASSILKLLLL